ncbi:MAG TPA: I78 family peptidase inhibitor [Sphingomicrobium sp.]|nr:I78 family peptidase inhibitor [Sphingomicrobium sp.]
MRPYIIALAALPFAACTIAESDPVPIRAEGNCRNEPLGQFIGQPAGEALGAQMLRASGAQTLRWVPKGGMVTMDFSPNRLTVQLDGTNRVEAARCG